MKEYIKISIICSVYNNEQYIHQCVDSILMQTMTEFELILIDNGCSDNCPNIIDEYAKQDSRITVLHNPKGSTYGKALNQGIQLAKGRYVGIVESDDFISPVMYEKLYNQIIKFNADVCNAGYWFHSNDKSNSNHGLNKLHYENSDDTKLFSISDYPQFMICPPTMWTKLYNSNFIKKIKFDEMGRYVDIDFVITVLCSTNSIISLKEPLYHYRMDNHNASTARPDNASIVIISDMDRARNILKNKGVYDLYKEEFYALMIRPLFGFYMNMKHTRNKKEMFDKSKDFLIELKGDENFTCKYFNDVYKKFIENLWNNKFLYHEYSIKKRVKFLSIPVWEILESDSKIKNKLFGITVYKREELPNGVVKKSFLKSLFKTKNNKIKKTIYFLGIKICNKNIFSKSEKFITDEICAIKNNLLELKEFIWQYNFHVNKVFVQHQKVFPQFKYKHTNQDIVIVGSGPSLNFYSGLDKALHISLNLAFRYPKIKFDYAFTCDRLGGERVGVNFIEELSNYDCIKFFGKYIHEEHLSVPEKYDDNIRNIYHYYGSARFGIGMPLIDNLIHSDLTTAPLMDYHSIVFAAFNFALFTNPQRIYLVGCDTALNGHYDGLAQPHLVISEIIEGCKKIKQFSANYYPEIEIISVNPVGLKGIFEDVYTQSYLNEYPELMHENIKILSEKI